MRRKKCNSENHAKPLVLGLADMRVFHSQVQLHLQAGS